MSQGMGKASASRRRSSDGNPYGDRPRVALPSYSSSKNMPSDSRHAVSPAASYFDASIPLNLPPRRSMKMLKDGSDFVWPDSAHALFVKGLQAWKYLNIGNKRTRAPRGEGKTDFLVRYLQSHGVQRNKKQVASHLQVLRTEWRNLDNPLLLSLVDDAATHMRSSSEPSLPKSSNSSPSTSSSVFEPSPDPGDDSAVSAPVLPSPTSTLPTQGSSSLFHPAHDIYARSHSYPEAIPVDTFRAHPSHNMGSWQPDNAGWPAVVDRFPSQSTDRFSRPAVHYPVQGFDPASSFESFHNYETASSPAVPSPASRGFSSNYYDVTNLQSHRDSSSSAAQVAHGSHSITSLPLVAARQQPSHAPMGSVSAYDSYNNPSHYPIQHPAPHDGFGNAANMSFGSESYQTQFSGELQQQQTSPSHAVGIAGSPSYDVAEPAFFPEARRAVQPQWLRPPAAFPRPLETPERQNVTPKLYSPS